MYHINLWIFTFYNLGTLNAVLILKASFSLFSSGNLDLKNAMTNQTHAIKTLSERDYSATLQQIANDTEQIQSLLKLLNNSQVYNHVEYMSAVEEFSLMLQGTNEDLKTVNASIDNLHKEAIDHDDDQMNIRTNASRKLNALSLDLKMMNDTFWTSCYNNQIHVQQNILVALNDSLETGNKEREQIMNTLASLNQTSFKHHEEGLLALLPIEASVQNVSFLLEQKSDLIINETQHVGLALKNSVHQAHHESIEYINTLISEGKLINHYESQSNYQPI